VPAPSGRAPQRNRGYLRPVPEFRPPATDDPDVQEAWEHAVHALHLRARSYAQLADHLRRKNVDPCLALSTADRMRELGLLCDATFARDWVERRGGTRGARVLAAELHERGVPDDDVAAALAGAPDPLDVARDVLAKHWSRLRELPEPARSRRAAGLLARRGLEPRLALAIIEEWTSAPPVRGTDSD
jgi:regulatory protein